MATGVNQHDGFKVMARDQRSVRDRFNKLLTDFKAKLRKEEGESRTNPEPLSEAETILEEIAEHIVSAKDDSSSPGKVSSSKSGAFSMSAKSSFSHGTLIGLLPVSIATVRCFLQSCCFKLSWPEKKMVANRNKHQRNILPSCK